MQPRPVTEDGANPARFTLAGPVDAATRRLLHEGREVGSVEGVDLVAHFRVDGIGWLIITDCDCPFEEMVFLHLFGDDLKPIETQTIGGMYVAGIVDDLEKRGPHCFALTFPDRQHRQMIVVEPRATGVIRKTTQWLHVMPD
jgi:hypothetical protein